MIYLHFIRHGEALFNIYHRMQGWCDTPLTAKGKDQAEDLAYGLAAIPWQRIYSSDSGRAMQTATIIAKEKQCSCVPKYGFREMFFGEMEGLDTYIGRLKDKDYRDHNGWVDVGGENMEMLQERMFHTIYEILPPDCEKEEHILIVSHGIAIMSLIERIHHRFYGKLEDYGGVLANTSVTTITYQQGQFELIDFNNTIFLENGRKIRNEKNYK